METPDALSLSIPIPLELLDYIDRRIELAVTKAIGVNSAEPDKPVYYTRHEVCALLKMSLPTVDRYLKHGIISGGKVGNRIVVSKANLETALTKIQSGRSEIKASGGFKYTGRHKTPGVEQSTTRRKS